MAYATVEELAAALRVRLPPANTASLQQKLDAAAVEIDAYLDRDPSDPLPVPPPPNVVEANINAGVDLAKAADAAFGIVGLSDIGALRVSSADAVARQAGLLTPHKTRWGIA